MESINTDLANISEISRLHKLVLNGAKSKLLVFGSANLNDFNIKVDGSTLTPSTCERNLGIFLDKRLRFEEHVSSVLQRAYYKLKLLYMHKDILTTDVKLRLCESLVLSLVSYGDVLYWPALTQREKNSLQKLQNCCLRFCYNARKYDHVTPLFQASGWLKMNERFFLHFSTLVHKIVNTKTPEYLYNKLVINTDVHERQMRNKQLFIVPRHRTAKFQGSFSYNAVRVYNALPVKVKSLSAVTGFRKSVKHFLLNK